MVPIRDDAGPQFVAGELLPNVVVVAWQHGMRAVAEMGAEPRAGGDGVANAFTSRSGVANRDGYAGRDQLLDELQSLLVFRRQSHELDSPARRFLQPAEFIPIG